MCDYINGSLNNVKKVHATCPYHTQEMLSEVRRMAVGFILLFYNVCIITQPYVLHQKYISKKMSINKKHKLQSASGLQACFLPCSPFFSLFCLYLNVFITEKEEEGILIFPVLCSKVQSCLLSWSCCDFQPLMMEARRREHRDIQSPEQAARVQALALTLERAQPPCWLGQQNTVLELWELSYVEWWDFPLRGIHVFGMHFLEGCRQQHGALTRTVCFWICVPFLSFFSFYFLLSLSLSLFF